MCGAGVCTIAAFCLHGQAPTVPRESLLHASSRLVGPVQGSMRTVVHRRRRRGSPPPDQSGHHGKNENLPLGKSGPAIFGTQTCGSPIPPSPSSSSSPNTSLALWNIPTKHNQVRYTGTERQIDLTFMVQLPPGRPPWPPRLLAAAEQAAHLAPLFQPALFTPTPTGGQPTPLSTSGGFAPQKANAYVHPEVPTGILFQP